MYYRKNNKFSFKNIKYGENQIDNLEVIKSIRGGIVIDWNYNLEIKDVIRIDVRVSMRNLLIK